jgi:hypothetical protein
MAAAPAPMLLQRASLAAAISALSEAQLGVGGYSKLQRMRTLARKTNFFAQLPQRLISERALERSPACARARLTLIAAKQMRCCSA